jgi:hypothetical protein
MRAAEIVLKGLLHVILQIQGLGTLLCHPIVSETCMPVEERSHTWTLRVADRMSKGEKGGLHVEMKKDRVNKN